MRHKFPFNILLTFNERSEIYLHNFISFQQLNLLTLFFFFNQLFLLHMDEIIPNIVDNNNAVDAGIGCSTITVNEPGNVSQIILTKLGI